MRVLIDRQHRHPVPLLHEVEPQPVDHGRLAHARHARDADAVRLARRGQQLLQQHLRHARVLRLAALDQRDGAPQHRPVAGPDAVGVVTDVEPSFPHLGQPNLL
jgi:hypothetical protein